MKRILTLFKGALVALLLTLTWGNKVTGQTLPSVSFTSAYIGTNDDFFYGVSADCGDTTSTIKLFVYLHQEDWELEWWSLEITNDTTFFGSVGNLFPGDSMSFHLEISNVFGATESTTVDSWVPYENSAPSVDNAFLLDVTPTSAVVQMQITNWGMDCQFISAIADMANPDIWLYDPYVIAADINAIDHVVDLTNLQPEHTYMFVASAENDWGTGADTVVFTTPALPEALEIIASEEEIAVGSSSMEVGFQLTVPSGTTADVYLYVGEDSEVNSSFFTAGPLFFESGIYNASVIVTGLDVDDADGYYGKWVAISSDGTISEDIFHFEQETYTNVSEEIAATHQWFYEGILHGFSDGIVEVFSMSGQLMYVCSGADEIDLSFLPRGMYMAQGSEKVLKFAVD